MPYVRLSCLTGSTARVCSKTCLSERELSKLDAVLLSATRYVRQESLTYEGEGLAKKPDVRLVAERGEVAGGERSGGQGQCTLKGELRIVACQS